MGIKKSKSNKDYNKLFYPIWIKLIGVCFMVELIFVTIMLLIDNHFDITFMVLIFALVVMYMMDLYLIILSFNWKLVILDDCIVYRNALGITHIYEYTDIIKIRKEFQTKHSLSKYEIFVSNKKIVVTCFVVNYKSSLATITRILKKKRVYPVIEDTII